MIHILLFTPLLGSKISYSLQLCVCAVARARLRLRQLRIRVRQADNRNVHNSLLIKQCLKVLHFTG